MNEERLQELLDEATVDCYDEEEAFWGLVATLGDMLHFPLHARLVEEPVSVTGLNEGRSSLRRGIVADIKKGERTATASLADLTFVNPDPISAEWLAAYRYWLGEQ